MSSTTADIVDLTDLTTAGLQQIGGTHGNTKRKALFWVAVFLLAVAFLCYQISYLVNNLESYPTAVDIQQEAFDSKSASKRKKRRYPESRQPQSKDIVEHGFNVRMGAETALTVFTKQTIHDLSDKAAKFNLTAKDISIGLGTAELVAMTSPELPSYSSDCQLSNSLPSLQDNSQVAAVDCSTPAMQCDLTPLQIDLIYGGLTSRQACFEKCIPLTPVSYRFNDNGGYCVCYRGDCCSSPLKAPRILAPIAYYFMGTVGYCDDVFSLQLYGSVDKSPPYYETLTVTNTCSKMSFTNQLKTFVVYTCQSTGVWSPSYTPCIPPCASQFQPATGSVPPGPYVPGTYVFTCITGYLTIGKTSSDTYVCSGGFWDRAFSPCIQTCNDQFISDSGSVSPGIPFMSGSTYTFTCKPNWLTSSFQPSVPYLCNSGSWLKPLAPCYAVCPNFFDQTGSAGPPPYTGFPKTYTFACLPGYLLPNYAATEQYTCQSDGNWNPTTFKSCIEECQPIVRPQNVMTVTYNGTMIQNLIPSGLSSSFACGINYTKFGTDRNANCYNGTWDMSRSQFPQCLANCNPLDPKTLFDRINVNYTNTDPIINSTTAMFTCNDNYHMYGDFRTTHCVNGSWDVAVVDLPICLEQQVAYYDVETLKVFANANKQETSSGRNDKLTWDGNMMEMIPYIISNLSTSMKSSLGFTRDDNLLSCTYGGRICDKSNDILGWNDNQMGNCYSFNHKYMNESIFAEKVGEEAGLHIYFDSTQEEFMSLLPTAGMKLIIHQSFDPIFPDTMGNTVSPGFNYIITVQRKREIRVETPKSVCYSSPSRVQHYFVENVTYAIEACQRSYYQPGIIDKCGCASPNLPSSHCGSTLCQLENRTCVIEYLRFNNRLDPIRQMVQICPPSCENTVNRLVITMTGNSDNGHIFDEREYSKHYQKANIISVKVYFGSLDVLTFKERVSYTFLDLINDIASSIGSIVGMSAISLVELIVLLAELIRYPIKKLTR